MGSGLVDGWSFFSLSSSMQAYTMYVFRTHVLSDRAVTNFLEGPHIVFESD